MKKANYGIDAPGVIRNLFIFSAVGFLVPLLFPVIRVSEVVISTSGFNGMGISCGLTGVWMLLYSTVGKLRHRERMLNMVDWKGSEHVLDIGTGRGLMAIGAAKRLSEGKATGIDIWNAEDLTSNRMENTLNNVRAEGVADKVEIINDNAVQMGFADQTFDLIFSNLCLHNIYSAGDRKKACHEINRVLKNGGSAIISDFKHMKEYKSHFDELGLQTELIPAAYLTTFPPLPILKIRKNGIES